MAEPFVPPFPTYRLTGLHSQSETHPRQGYNGSQLWDTAFALQAIVETGMGDDYRGCLSKGYDYLECSQVCLIPIGRVDRARVHVLAG